MRCTYICVTSLQANMDELRMDDVFALKPELKAQLDEDIKNNKW